MMKLLKNEKLARWVVGIVIVGTVMAYVPLIFVPPTPEQQPPAPEAFAPPAPEPVTVTASSFATETRATATPPLPVGGTVRLEVSTGTAR